MSPVTGQCVRVFGWLLAVAIVLAVADWHTRADAQQNPEAQGAEAGQPNVAAENVADEDAGESADAGAPQSETPAKQATQSLGMMIVQSGSLSIVFYVLLFAFSLVACMVAMERAIHLRRAQVLPPSFAGTLRDLIRSSDDNEDRLKQLCQSNPSPVARILEAGLLRAGRPLPEVEKSMEDAAAREMAELRSRNRPLSVVGSIAPLVGLLGTVVGMIFAFGTASQVGLGKAEELAKGIYLALMTTAGGLSIAIPALLLAAWFNARAERYMREIDQCLLETMPSFTRMETHGQASVSPRDELVGAGSP